MLQGMLQGAGLVGYCPKVLKGVLLAGRFVPGSSFLAFMFLVFRFWALRLLGALEALEALEAMGAIGSDTEVYGVERNNNGPTNS